MDGVNSLDTRQLVSLALLIAVSGAGGSLVTRTTSSPTSATLAPIAVLRQEQERQERRIEALTRRVRDLEKSLPS
jgi:hypothetical protein